MNRVIFIILLCFLLVSTTQAQGTINPIDKAMQSCVYIKVTDNNNGTYLGSGFAVAGNKIMTCYHVVTTNTKIEVTDNNNKKYKVISRSLKPTQDIAILTIDGYIPPIVTNTNYNNADVVYTIATPKIESLKNTITMGIISYKERSGYIQFDAHITGGCSGGALVNKNGEAIGVIRSMFKDVNNGNIAIPIKSVRW